jgi:hypothetical protein
MKFVTDTLKPLIELIERDTFLVLANVAHKTKVKSARSELRYKVSNTQFPFREKITFACGAFHSSPQTRVP